MLISPTAVTLLVLSSLAFLWLAARERVVRLDGMQPYHVGAYQRDRRKARFYFFSVWMGLLAGFIGMATLQIVANTLLATTALKNWVSGSAYGIGLWGLLIITMVWTQVGQRVSQPNSDGQSLQPLNNERDGKKK